MLRRPEHQAGRSPPWNHVLPKEADLARYYYGVVWIPKGDPAKIAQRVKAVLMKTNFAAKLQQVVRA